MDPQIQPFITKKAGQPKNNISKYLLMLIIPGLSFCSKGTTKENNFLSQDSLTQISAEWILDSTGCDRRRNPKKIRQLIIQLELVGKDSSTLIKYLGKPNGRNNLTNGVVFYYYLACSAKQRSNYNFYCYIEKGKLLSTQTAILD